MALLHCNFYSEVLEISCSMEVILPQKTSTQIGLQNKSFSSSPPVLYLLHGLTDDHTIWQRRTSIERYVAPLGLAVIMPAVGRSFYTNMVNGPAYWDFISQELPQIVHQFFNLSSQPEDTFVAGLSMGGYGALKLAFTFPERFAAAASLSGVMDIYQLIKNQPQREKEFHNIFGDIEAIPSSQNDLFYLATKCVKEERKLPKSNTTN